MELPPGPMIRDTLNRPLGSLRVSVTDRCNLRCRYCMPEAEYVWLPKSSILTFEEIARLVRIFTGPRRRQGPSAGRRAAAAPRPADARPDAGGESRHSRPRAHNQRTAPRTTGRGAAARAAEIGRAHV